MMTIIIVAMDYHIMSCIHVLATHSSRGYAPINTNLSNAPSTKCLPPGTKLQLMWLPPTKLQPTLKEAVYVPAMTFSIEQIRN